MATRAALFRAVAAATAASAASAASAVVPEQSLLPPAAATFSCGDGCTAQIEPWCDDSLRVRMFVGAAPLDDAAGALGPSCSAERATAARSSATSITNGGIAASWAGGKLSFSHVGGAEFLASAGPIADAFALAARAAPPPPAPGPPKFACQDSCTLGATGIKEQTDAEACAGIEKLLNVTRAACCAACANNTRCVAWAWGRDTADPAHRHNCYECGSLSGTHHSPDRDFGCVERAGLDAPPRAAPPRTNYSYHATRGVFSSTPDEILVGLGQRSMAGNDGCTGGARCGQQKLNQKGYTWPLGMTKYQISVPWCGCCSLPACSTCRCYVCGLSSHRSALTHTRVCAGMCRAVGMASCGMHR